MNRGFIIRFRRPQALRFTHADRTVFRIGEAAGRYQLLRNFLVSALVTALTRRDVAFMRRAGN